MTLSKGLDKKEKKILLEELNAKGINEENYFKFLDDFKKGDYEILRKLNL